jgi:hypothetical protein
MPEIQDKNKLSVEAAPTTRSAGKLIRAKDFLDCFRQSPDDLHLMRKFSLSPRQLEKVYAALIDKGLLAEFEYNHRGIAAGASEGSIGEPDPQPGSELVRPGPASEIRGSEPPRGQTHLSGNPGTVASGRPTKRFLKTPDFCPICHRVTNSCSPDTCISCGVVLSKLLPSGKKQQVSIWEPDYRYK